MAFVHFDGLKTVQIRSILRVGRNPRMVRGTVKQRKRKMNRRVMHKERGEEKGKSPHTPLKEKEGQKETTDIDIRHRMTASAETPSGIHVGYRRPDLASLCAEDFFSGEYDPVDIAIAVTGGRRNDRALWRTYLRNGSIEEGKFLEVCFTQWREDMSDGYPDNPAACLTKKLRPFLSGTREGGAA